MTGLSIDDQRRAAGLQALPPVPVEEEIPDDKPECQHGCATMPCRHTRTEEKHKQHPASALRGVPILGRGVGGAMDGTRPGDLVSELQASIDELYEQAIRNRSRFKPPKKS